MKQQHLTQPHFLSDLSPASAELKSVQLITLTNQNQLSVTFTNYGATWVRAQMPNAHGVMTDLILGYDQLKAYLAGNCYLGATVGPVANRVKHGRLQIGDQCWQLPQNEGVNCLHSGDIGISHRIWDVTQVCADRFQMKLSFNAVPGVYEANLDMRLDASLTEDNQLRLTYTVVPDTRTYLNLTQHSYFNLNGSGRVDDHVIQIANTAYQVVDTQNIPTGEWCSVAGTPYDFNAEMTLKTAIQATQKTGFDHAFKLKGEGLRTVAKAWSRQSGIALEMATNQPSLQFYTGYYLPESQGLFDQRIVSLGGFCLEPQAPVDETHIIAPSDMIYTEANERYINDNIYRFRVCP